MARTSSSSRRVSRSVAAIVTTRPTTSAALMTPAAIDEKYGSAMSATSRATVMVEPLATAWAERLGV